MSGSKKSGEASENKKPLETIDKYLSGVTSLGVILFALIIAIYNQAVGKDKISNTFLLWSIVVILCFLAGSEYLKRIVLLARLEDKIGGIEEKLDIISSGSFTGVTKLSNREHMYEECARLIKKTQESIIDTTWGRAPSDTSKISTEAREKYRNAVVEVLSNRNIRYREIYTISRGRIEDLLDTLKYREPKTIRVLRGIKEIPLIEFIIFDTSKMIFSRVYSEGEEMTDAKYFLVENTILVELFKNFFDDMWREATRIKFNETDSEYYYLDERGELAEMIRNSD